MTDFDREMQKALEADGEKLLQLTGEDHGPWDLEAFDDAKAAVGDSGVFSEDQVYALWRMIDALRTGGAK